MTRDTIFALIGAVLVVYAILGKNITTIQYKDSKITIKPLADSIRILLAVIGVVFVVFSFLSDDLLKTAVVKPTATATQTNTVAPTSTTMPTFTAIPTDTPMPSATQMPSETPLPTFTATPAPIIIVDTATQWDWVLNFNSANSETNQNTFSVSDGALLLAFDVGKEGYVVLTSDIPAEVLSEAEGVSFQYKGSGADNSIEFKLILRFPGDTDDTTYGRLIRHSSNTGGEWIQVDLAFSDLTCWWPEENCDKYGDLLDPNMVRRMDFVVANKSDANDEPGKGVIYFMDVFAIIP